MSKLFTPADRRRIAAKVRVSEQYLYQCLTARRDMGPVEAVRIARESEHEVQVWDVCHRTWHLIWPHLIGAEGAPPVSAGERVHQSPSPVHEEGARA